MHTGLIARLWQIRLPRYHRPALRPAVSVMPEYP